MGEKKKKSNENIHIHPIRNGKYGENDKKENKNIEEKRHKLLKYGR